MKLGRIFSQKLVNHSRRFLMVALWMVIALFLCPAKASAQLGTTLWTNRYNGPGNGGDFANAVAVDGSGNVFVTGYHWGGSSSHDYATIAYSSAGLPLWTNRYNGSGNSSDAAYAIAVDSSGNVFVTGYSMGIGSSDDYTTIKYSSSGLPMWTNRDNGPGNSTDIAAAVAVDGSGNVFVTGYSYGSGSSYDYATIAYSGAGVSLWTNRYNGPGNGDDFAAAVVVDGSGNVFVTGFSGVSGSSEDYTTIKYSRAGVPLWTNRYDGPGNNSDRAKAIAVDSSGNVFVTGYSGGSGGSLDYTTIKYSSAGVSLWTNRYNGPGNGSAVANAVAVDGSGNVYVTGQSSGSGSSYDYATIAYSSAGLGLWTNRYNGPGHGIDNARAVAVDGSSNVIVTGESAGSGSSPDYTTIAYSRAGVPLWTNRYDGLGNDIAYAIAVDSSGNIYITGQSDSDYATIKIQGMPQPLHNAALQTLPDYQYDGSNGRHVIRDLRASGDGRFSFVFATADIGARCLVSWTTTMREWFPLIHFDATTVGTKITDSTPAQQTFYRTTYLPTGVLPAYDFDYPIGNGGYIPEQITPERNEDDLYPAHPRAEPNRGHEPCVGVTGWRNAQDVASYYPDSVDGDGLHPGEDWNKGCDADDVGSNVLCVANGRIITTRLANPASLGYVMVIRHWLLNGDSVDSIYVHIAPDKIAGVANRGGVFGNESDFSYQEGSAVTKGSIIGVIGLTSHPHLHFEMRNKPADPADLWPHDIGNGYYGAVKGLDGKRRPPINQADTTAAFELMKLDGIIDPSDFIDDHRPSQ